MVSNIGSVNSLNFFTDMFDPQSLTRTLNLNLMDLGMGTGKREWIDGRTRGGWDLTDLGTGAGGTRGGWDVIEEEKGLYIRIDMPGVGKEDVKVSVEENTMTITGEGDKESGYRESGRRGRRYYNTIVIPMKLFKMDQIKAEMKNGVLTIVILKVKEEESKDIHHVQIECS
ncbi:23.6 kDa heat shock protein, mitochondrial-like [Telopea speciosissima]|uniref:23.6 kDa heat shock protein, mitochondrial-like n=1 Tax=Telopea speciosissima TaxID=54955 RepID=UPI001CC6E099|nr:23.6 kDa heat shock protein, mitochondrial-like [Telopea speciosissima]